MKSKNRKNFSGILLPDFSDISSILELKYYYNDLNSSTGWTLIDENNTKANGVLNGTEVIAYNLFGVNNPAAKPSAKSNYGASSTKTNFVNISKYLTGDLDFENIYLDGNLLNLNLNNFSYSSNLRDDVYYSSTHINELINVLGENGEIIVWLWMV